MNSNFIVYAHIRPDTNQMFYIGKGLNHRIRQKSNRNKYWHNIVNKNNGFESQIIAGNLTETEALNFEKLLIQKLRIAGVNLCNMTDGGDGVSGYRHTEQTRRNFSESRKGRVSPTFGKKLSDEHRRKLSLAKLGKPASELNRINSAKARVGRIVSAETRAKLSAKNVGRKPSEESLAKLRKPVVCLNTGIVYKSVTDAAKQLGLETTNISKVCKGKLKKTGNLQFKYA